jgi:hypothetical protein
MIKVKASVTGVPKVARELDHLGRELGIGAKEMTRIIGRSVALFGVRETYPRTISAKARKQGERSVEIDFYKVVGIDKGGVASAGIVDKWQAERRRPTTGRASRPPGGKHRDPSTLYATQEALSDAITQRQKMVGWAKGQWAGVAAKLGPAIPTKWITRHRATESIVDLQSSIMGTKLTIGSRADFASQVFPSDMQRRAVTQGTKNGISFMRRKAKAEAAKTTNKLR